VKKTAEVALTKKQLSELHARLVEETEKMQASPGGEVFEQSKDDNTDETDMACADYTQAQVLRMKNRELFYAKKVERALKKFQDGEYGVCEDCGTQIKFQRLLARPTAELCIDCKEEAERDELSSIFSKQPKSLGEMFKSPSVSSL
jgi:DnaK suppressor protein